MRFRFIHCADLHLDSPLRGLSDYAGLPADTVRSATRQAFVGLVDYAIAERVNFIVVSGDVVDGENDQSSTGRFFHQQLQRAYEAGIASYVLTGNHCAAAKLFRRRALPHGVHLFDDKAPEAFEIPQLKVRLIGRSFPERDVFENYALSYPVASDPAWFHIGVLHTALAGAEGHAPYAPCSLADLHSRGYDYWALGHVHNRAVVASEPSWVVFPGNLQGRSVRETGGKGAVVVTVADGKVASVEPVDFSVLHWAECRHAPGEADTFEQAVVAAVDSLATAVSVADGRPVVARVRVVGPAHFFGTERRSADQDRETVVSHLQRRFGDRVWLESLKVQVSPSQKAPVSTLAALEPSLREVAADPDVMALLQAEVADALGVLPLPPDRLPEDLRAFSADPTGLVGAAVGSLLSGQE